MKKYMICFVSALVLGFSSCDLMDLKPLDQLSEEDVWNDEELLQLYVNGCYNALQHGYRYTDMMGIYCDEMYTLSPFERRPRRRVSRRDHGCRQHYRHGHS